MTGEIKRLLTDKAFGFILGEDHKEYFFHRQGFRGNWDELVEDVHAKEKIYVEFEEVDSPKGPRAENVERLDKPYEEERVSGKGQRTAGKGRRY